MTFPTLNLPVIAPQVVLVAAALVILLADLVIAEKRILGWIGLVATLGALAAVFVCRSASPSFQPAPPPTPPNLGGPGGQFGPGSMALADGLGLFASATVLIAAALAILLAMERAADFTRRIGAYYALLLLATAGMTAMATASDLMTIFIALEIFSLALYILVGFNRRDARSAEAALKYFLLGAFASGFFLYGIALIYAATGTTGLEALTKGILPMSVSLPFAPLLPVGMGLLLVGFGFKVALVPFHMWTPDA
ncbi:MAG: proton-conducting transporter membrane subunit, partial [Anaerolineae bacterium]